jgi:ABC-type antimicrobial peptide transport system permease subunit
VLARLHPGVTWAQAQAEVAHLGQIAIRERHLPGDISASLRLIPLQAGLTEQVRTPLLILWAAVGSVLLIGCVNIAGLQLARSANRSRDIATRMALGGSKGAVIRQLLVESLLLAVLPFSSFKSMDEVRAESVAFQRVTATLLSTLAGLALLLAGLGIYGLIANTVVERTRELGIRMAVGATMLQAMKAVVLPGMALAGVGLFAGCIASLGTTRYLRSLLWGVRPTDALTLAVVCGLLMTVAILASVVPGLRVAKIDPAISLRGN